MKRKIIITAALSLVMTAMQASTVMAAADDVSAYKWGSWEKMVAPAAGPVFVPTATVGTVPQPSYKPDPTPVEPKKEIKQPEIIIDSRDKASKPGNNLLKFRD